MNHDPAGSKHGALPAWAIDLLWSVVIAVLFATIAIFSQGVGLKFLYFAF